MQHLNVASILADRVGPEFISVGIEVVLAACDRNTNVKGAFTHFDWGSDYFKQHGMMMTEDGLDKLRGFDVIYFGAVGAPDVLDHFTF